MALPLRPRLADPARIITHCAEAYGDEDMRTAARDCRLCRQRARIVGIGDNGRLGRAMVGRDARIPNIGSAGLLNSKKGKVVLWAGLAAIVTTALLTRAHSPAGNMSAIVIPSAPHLKVSEEAEPAASPIASASAS